MHPMTAILTPLRCEVCTFICSVVLSKSKNVRPHDGQEIKSALKILDRVDCKIERATGISFSDGSVSETLIVSPKPSQSKAPIPTALFIRPSSSLPASVTPKCRG